MLADGGVQADTEATVLAAFCCWVESKPAGDRSRRDTDERIAAILSRIRLPAIPPALLHCFWAQFAFLRRWDPGNQILLRAVSGYRSNATMCSVVHMWLQPSQCCAGCMGVTLGSRMLPNTCLTADLRGR